MQKKMFAFGVAVILLFLTSQIAIAQWQDATPAGCSAEIRKTAYDGEGIGISNQNSGTKGSSTTACRISCLDKRQKDARTGTHPIVDKCALPDDYYAIVTDYSTASDVYNQVPIANCGNCDGLASSPCSSGTQQLACRLPYYSPELYVKRCVTSIDDDVDNNPDKKTDYTREDKVYQHKRCCGNFGNKVGGVIGTKFDAGMIFDSVDLCIRNSLEPTGKWEWLKATIAESPDKTPIPYKIFTVDRGLDGGKTTHFYDTVSNTEQFFVCKPKDGKGLANPSTSKALSALQPLGLPSGEPSFSIGGGTGGGTKGNDINDFNPEVNIITPTQDDADGDGFTNEDKGGTDCNDNDPTIFPGAFDPCGDSIDQACDDKEGVEKCTQVTRTLKNKDKAARFICYNEDNKGAFAECCNGVSCDNSPPKRRTIGEPLASISDFNKIGDTVCEAGKNCIGTFVQVVGAADSAISGEPFYSYPLIIDNAPAKGTGKAEHEINDWTPYNALEFYINTPNSYILDVALLGGTKCAANDMYQKRCVLCRLPVKDYVANSHALKKWMHVKVPLGDCTGNLKNVEGVVFLSKENDLKAFGNIFKYQNKNVYNVIGIDRVSLSGSQPKFCSGSFYHPTNLQNMWIDDLDYNEKGGDDMEGGKTACDKTPGFGWTGTQCCGDDSTRDEPEYYADKGAGCWIGNRVASNSRVGNIEFKAGDITQIESCAAHSCVYPISGSGRPMVANLHPDIYEMRFREKGAVQPVPISSPPGRQSETEIAEVKADNIPLQILFYNISFYGCDTKDFNKKPIVQNAQFCTVKGKYFCSYRRFPIQVGEWSDEGGAKFTAADRDTNSRVPITTPGELELFFDTKNQSFFEQGCCPSNYCWNGISCVDGIPETLSLNGPGQQTTYALFKDSFTKHFGFRRGNPFDQYVCIAKLPARQGQTIAVEIRNSEFSPKDIKIEPGDKVKWTNADSSKRRLVVGTFINIELGAGQSAEKDFAAPGTFPAGIDSATQKGTITVAAKGIVAQWKESYYKERPDNRSSVESTAQGYCLSNSQCWNGGKCVGTGAFEQDYFCEEGNWTTRTKYLAMKMLAVAQAKSPDNYALFCDNYTQSLNTFAYEPALSFLESNANNFCVLRYKEGAEERTMLGTSLNQPFSSSLAQFIDVINRNHLPTIESCADGMDNDGLFHQCKSADKRLWYNNVTGLAIYTKYGVDGIGPLDGKAIFLQFFRHPLRTIIDLIVNFIRPVRQEAIGTLGQLQGDFLKSLRQFNRIYLSHAKPRSVLGVEEVIDYTKPYMNVNYFNFTADVCSKVQGTAFQCYPTVVAEQELPTYIVTSFEEAGFAAWIDATAKARITEKEITGTKPSAVILEPLDNTELSTMSRFNLRAQEDANIAFYYWDLDQLGNVVKGEVSGRNLVQQDVNTLFKRKEGFHKIALLTIGTNGKANAAYRTICINNFNKPNPDNDRDGKPDGCDADDDNDGVLDSGDGDYLEGNHPCKGGQTTTCDDNCRLIANPNQADSDGNGIGDICESDSDKDGVPNNLDVWKNDPAVAYDTDKDGKPDSFLPGKSAGESTTGFKAICSSPEDKLCIDDDDDNDGLLDANEPAGCQFIVDCDGDGISDGVEAHTHRTSPIDRDTDKDGITDPDEINGAKGFVTNATLADTDGDSFSTIKMDDLIEINTHKTNPTKKDTDNDKMPDGWELYYGLNPLNAADGNGDLDNDGLKNSDEFLGNADPKNPDSDNDGIRDGDDPEPDKPAAPRILNTYPRNATTVIAVSFINATTDKNSVCRYGTGDNLFDELPNVFIESNGIEHKTPVTASGGENTIYIRCKDTFGNRMQESYVLLFTYDNVALSITDTKPSGSDKLNALSFRLNVTTSRDATCVSAQTAAELSFTLPPMATSDKRNHTAQHSLRQKVDALLTPCTSDASRESSTSLSTNLKYWACVGLAKSTNLCSNVVNADEKQGCIKEGEDYQKIKNGEDVPTTTPDDAKFKQAIQQNNIALCEEISNSVRKTGCKAAISQNPNHCVFAFCQSTYTAAYEYFVQCKDEYGRQINPVKVVVHLNETNQLIPIVQ